MRPLHAGEMRHEITFQELTTSQNAYGEAVETYTDKDTVWASVLPASVGFNRVSTEFLEAQKINVNESLMVRVWHRSISPTWRVKIDGISYRIVSAPQDPFGNKSELYFYASEVVV